MKIIHFADLHIGVENYSRLDSESGLSTRLLDFLKAFDTLVDYAISEKVDLVVFAGDAYKSRDPNQTQQREFAKRIKRLSENGIPTFLLVGNHDLPNSIGRATTADIFSTLGVENVYVSQKPEIVKIDTKSGAIQVASLPWLRRSTMISQLSKNNETELSFEKINERIQGLLTSVIDSHANKLDAKLPSILAAHVWVSEASLGSERSMTIGQEHVLLLSNVANQKFDYVALGHLHKAQVLSEKPPVIYSGSMERVDFGEEHDDKGFYLINIKENENGVRKTSYEFKKLDARRFFTLKIEIDENELDPTIKVLGEIEKNKEQINDAVVRLSITLPAELEKGLNDNALHKALSGAHYFTISKDIKREVRLRFASKNAEEVSPKEALKEYVNMQKYSKEFAGKLITAGEKLLEEQS